MAVLGEGARGMGVPHPLILGKKRKKSQKEEKPAGQADNRGTEQKSYLRGSLMVSFTKTLRATFYI